MLRHPVLLLAGLLGTLAAAAPAQLPGNFVDITTNHGAPDWCGISNSYQLVNTTLGKYSMSGGAACADFNNDGWIDVFFPGGHNQASQLYRNLGNGTFVEEAALRGVTDTPTASSVGLFIDYDDDGDLDLFVVAHVGVTGVPLGPLFHLFRNSGAAGGYTFVDVTASAGFALAPTLEGNTHGWVGGLSFGDYNADGYLDFFASWWWDAAGGNMWRLMRSAPNPAPGDPTDPSYTPRIFVDATIEAGLNVPIIGEPWQSLWLDYNRDGRLDLHVNVDFDLDYMYRNNGDGTFTDVCSALGLNGAPTEPRNEMGAAVADIDNDGDFDFHLTNLFEVDRFYRCDSFPGGASYTDVALTTGLFDSQWGWGDVFFDFDLDGDLDHATVSGWKFPTALSWYNNFHINLYPQTLGDGVTTKWQNATFDLPNFTKVQTSFGDNARGLTWLDFDNDGDVDLLESLHTDPAVLYRNTLSTSNRWLQVDLVNSGGSLNTVSAVAWLKTGDRVQMRQVHAGSSFHNQEPPRLHFGLGPAPAGASPPTATVQGGLRVGGAAGSAAKKPGAPSGPTAPAPGLTWGDPAWLVVRWPDGPLQIVRNPQPNQVLKVLRSAVDDRGDLDGDGHLTSVDEAMLLLAATDLAAYKAAYPQAPGLVTGDVDGNGFIQMADHAAWTLLPPH